MTEMITVSDPPHSKGLCKMFVKDITIGSHVVLHGHPCQVMATATLYPGKCGRHRKIVKGCDVLTDAIYDDSFDNATQTLASFTIETKQCTIIGIDDQGYAIIKGFENEEKYLNMDICDLFDCNRMKTMLETGKYEAIVTYQTVDIPEQKYGCIFEPSDMPHSRHDRIITFDVKHKK